MASVTSSRAIGSDDLQSSLDSKKVITECCECSGSCRFQMVHSGYSTPASFVTTSPRGVELRISPENAEEKFSPQSICCVSFPYRTSFCAFLGCLMDVRLLSSGERRLTVSIPQQLMTTNLRQSFRVPVIKDSGLQSLIRTAVDQTYDVVVRDIADAGIEIEFSVGNVPELTVGRFLDVELRFRDETIQRRGEVRRVTGNKVGLAFNPQPEDEQENQQAIRMNGLVLAIQQLWLRSRLK